MELVADDPGREALAPKVPAAPVTDVVLARVDAVQPFERAAEIVCRRLDEHVVMRPHQAVDVDGDGVAQRHSAHQPPEEVAVEVVAERVDLVDRVRRHVEEPVRQLAAGNPAHAPDATPRRHRATRGGALRLHFRHAFVRPGRWQPPDVAPRG
ncbi:MAG TPA: hypothetical protein VKB13_08890 [Gaiellaceae bacterium]|nr:hypothetical protein [Gaiellaceae bacterium]